MINKDTLDGLVFAYNTCRRGNLPLTLSSEEEKIQDFLDACVNEVATGALNGKENAQEEISNTITI